MYQTMKFKNDVYADILKDEVIAWCHHREYGQEHKVTRQYKDDNELLNVLKFVSELVNSNNHRDVFDVLFSLADEFIIETRWEYDGSLSIYASNLIGGDYDRFMKQLYDEILELEMGDDLSTTLGQKKDITGSIVLHTYIVHNDITIATIK